MKATGNVIVLAVSLILVTGGAASAQIGPGPFSAFPTANPADGRFLGFGCAGIATFEQAVTIGMAAPADSTDFTVNVFDGETGKPDGAGKPHWDAGSRQLVFRLYADPLRQGTTAPGNLIGEWKGNDPNPLAGPFWVASAASMSDNDWWAVVVTNSALAKAPSGNYFYSLEISLDGNCAVGEVLESNLKVAASNPMTFLMPKFGLEAGLRQIFNDGPIIYPGTFPPPGGFVTAPTTYDGTFEFFLSLPAGRTDLQLFDGDLDFGTAGITGLPSGTVLEPCLEDDDLNTEPDYSSFPFDTTGVSSEGAAGPGSPADDTAIDAFRRGEPGSPGRIGCVRYEVIDPDGTIYRNDNPSGNLEWEQFRIATPLAVNPGDADHVASTDILPPGVWKVKVVGLDLSNVVFWYVQAACSARATPAGLEAACPGSSVYLLGDTVWLDTNGNGMHDAGESGISGVKLELLSNPGSPAVTTMVTGDDANPNWAACAQNNTGLDEQGLYCLGTDQPGSYTVRVATENFLPGGALEGTASTTGGDAQSDSLSGANILTLDFGYRGTASLGDRIWIDLDGDDQQEPGEPGLVGVTVTLLDANLQVLASAVTGADGMYSFSNLMGGTYTVQVSAGTIPPGLVPTYDLDGIATPHAATAGLAPGAHRNDLDFGYLSPSAAGTGTIGYWKNHPQAWPVALLTLGGQVYTKEQAIEWMKSPGRGDKSIDLFKQFVAATLNVVAGNESFCITSTLAAADAWLAANPLGSNVHSGSSAWSVGGPLHATLDQYNNGQLCAPHRG